MGYKPYMGSRTSTNSPQDCQHRCQTTDNCEYFSWWSDHGCKIAGKGAKLGTSSKPPVSGPRNCLEAENKKKEDEAAAQQVRDALDAAQKKQEEEAAALKKKEEEAAALKKK